LAWDLFRIYALLVNLIFPQRPHSSPCPPPACHRQVHGAGFNAGMRGNGGQVAMAVCDLGPMTSRRPARHCHVCRHCSYPASEALAGGWQAGDAGGRQGGLVLAWDLFRIYALLVNLIFYQRPHSSPFFPTILPHVSLGIKNDFFEKDTSTFKAFYFHNDVPLIKKPAYNLNTSKEAKNNSCIKPFP